MDNVTSHGPWETSDHVPVRSFSDILGEPWACWGRNNVWVRTTEGKDACGVNWLDNSLPEKRGLSEVPLRSCFN